MVNNKKWANSTTSKIDNRETILLRSNPMTPKTKEIKGYEACEKDFIETNYGMLAEVLVKELK